MDYVADVRKACDVNVSTRNYYADDHTQHSITFSGEGYKNKNGEDVFLEGLYVRFTAQPANGYSLIHWEDGDGNRLGGYYYQNLMIEEGLTAVSYTHLDVYKRQVFGDRR